MSTREIAEFKIPFNSVDFRKKQHTLNTQAVSGFHWGNGVLEAVMAGFWLEL